MKTTDSRSIELWTIYDNPSDFPGQFVARRFDMTPGQEPRPTSEALLGKDFSDIEAHFIKNGYVWLPRNSGDDPVIVGTYLC